MFDLSALSLPIIAAPMAGGPTTPQLVIDTCRAGGWGVLAGANKSVEAMATEVEQVRSSGFPVGVNLFVPDENKSDAATSAALENMRARLGALAEKFAVTPGEPAWDDDGFDAKVAWLLAHPVHVVTFMLGVPEAALIERFHSVATRVGVMVTKVPDAVAANEAGADFLIVQGPEAGGHQALCHIDDAPNTLALPDLFDAVRDEVNVPLVVAGGIATPDDVQDALALGAEAVQVGTAFLRSSSAGSNATHRAALVDPSFTETRLTRAFSGRYARGLANTWMDEFADAPAAYPQTNRLTAPIRKAAAAQGDPQWTHLWAGRGWRRSAEAAPAGLLDGEAGAIARWLAGK